MTKFHGRIHRLWSKWCETVYLSDVRWPWRIVCWVQRNHHSNEWLDWNYGRTYCCMCDKTISKDAWRIKRDQGET